MINQDPTPAQKGKSAVPPKPQSKGVAVDELIALRHEISEFRKDFKKFGNELSLKVAFGVIGSLVIMWIVAAFFAILVSTHH